MAWHAVKTWNARIAEMLRCRYDQHARTRIILSKTLKRSQRIKKHGPKTVLNALERSRTIDVSPEKYALSENGGPAGGPLGCESDSVASLKAQALNDLQRASKLLRRLQDLSGGPEESNVAGRAATFVETALEELSDLNPSKSLD